MRLFSVLGVRNINSATHHKLMQAIDVQEMQVLCHSC